MSTDRQQTTRAKYDALYKTVFTQKRTVADTLSGIAGDIARHLDFATLERRPASFVTEHLGQRHADMLWRVQTRNGEWLHIMVLLEFQSTVRRDMALRMTDYTVRILQGLNTEDLGPDGKYPAVLPIVIYNGRRPWTAAGDIHDLFGAVPDELLGYLPRHKYLPVDLHRLDPVALGLGNVLAMMTQLEQAPTDTAVRELIAPLKRRLGRIGEPELERAFEAWVIHALARHYGQAGEEFASRLQEEGVADMTLTTIADRMAEWGEERRRRWREAAQAAAQDALAKGMDAGRREGIETGRIEGERKSVLRLAARRFGPDVAERLRPLLEEMSDTEAIGAVFDAVFDSATAAELFARVRIS